MPPFQYTNPTNPFALSIAQALENRGTIAAQGAERVGDIEANAQRQVGQAWGQAAQSIGQDVSQIPAQQQQQQQRQLQTTALGQENTQRQQQIDLANKVTAMKQQIGAFMNDPSVINEDGTLNAKSIAAKMAGPLPKGASGPTQAPDMSVLYGILDPINDSITKASASQKAWQTDKTNTMARMAAGVLKLGAPTEAAPQGSYLQVAAPAIAALLKSNHITEADANQAIAHIVENPVPVLQSLVSLSTEPDVKVGKDEAFVNPLTKTVDFSNVPADEGAYTINGQRFDRTGKPIGPVVPPQARPTQDTNEWKDVLLDGKPAKVFVDPKTRAVTTLSGQVVTNPEARIKPVPPAAVQVQNNIAAQAAAAPLVDASRPTGPTANKIDPKTALTPNAIFQNAVEFGLTGRLPQTGRGSDQIAVAQRTGVQNKAAAIAAAAGVDLPTVQAEYRANSGALNKLLPQAAATATFANTATDNLDLALQQSAQVARTGAKLPNRYLQWVQGNLTPAAGLTKFETYVYTAAREYAKVTNGGAASAQGLTDSAQREASKLLNTAQSSDAFSAAVDAMKNDMANVVSEQTKKLNGISNTIASFFAAANGLPAPAGGSQAAPGASAPAAKTMRVVGPNGQTGTVPAGTALPAGWKAAP